MRVQCRALPHLAVILVVMSAVSLAQRIAYLGPNPNTPGTTAVFLINPDGTNPQLVPVNLVGLENPKWSRDARLIVAEATAPGGGTPDIFVFDRAGNNLRQITNLDPGQIVPGTTVAELFPAISPDGKRLVVNELFNVPDSSGTAHQDLIIQIFSMDGTAGPFIQGIAYSPGLYDNSGWGVDWSPKADVLAVPNGTVYQCPNNPLLFVDATEIWAVPVPQVSNNSSSLPQGSVPVTNTGALACSIFPAQVFNVLPVFSPDGTKLAFVRWLQAINGVTDSSIRVISLNGTGEQEVVRLVGAKTFGLSWSGDGTQLVFDQLPEINGVPQEQLATVLKINLNGTGLVKIVGPPAGEPAWSWGAPVPRLTSLNPSSTVAGGLTFTLAVNGANFVAGSVVQWNGANRTTKFTSATQLQATILAGDIASSRIAQVTVLNPAPGGGKSNALNFTVNDPVPTLSSLSPSSAMAGSQGFQLTVNGSHFVANSLVQWNGGNRATSFISNTRLVASISASDIATAGTVAVRVFNPAPGGGESNALNFVINSAAAPVVTLSPSSLAFATQLVGTSSAAKTVKLTNSGTATLAITAIAAIGDFVVASKTCGSTLAAGASCTINISFHPSATGTRTGAVSISDNAAGSPQKISLSGTGTIVGFSTASVNFGDQLLGTISAARTVSLTNHSSSSLTIIAISITGTNAGDFTISGNTCGSSVAAGASCTVSIRFKPSAINTRSANLNVSDNGGGSPQLVQLAGAGTVVSLSPAGLTFASQPVGTTSVPKVITLTNHATAALIITGTTIAGTNASDFAISSKTCASTVAAGASCTIDITFKPAAAGSRKGILNINDNGGGSPQTVSLNGAGI